jgi:hypothetical protein
MNRREAILAGLKTYNSGRPCAKGHTSDRYTSCGMCIACLKDGRAEATRLRTAILAARTPDTALFAYKLHPDDHAAALAFCQALDLQRGRMPVAPEATVVRSQPSGPPALPAWLAAARQAAPDLGAGHDQYRAEK